MIRVTKPAKPPAILRKRGADETQELCDAFDASPGDYLSGTETFDFNNGIYGAKSVKNTLRKAQHEKCCFCESKITHVAYGDVEHFRPKGGYKQRTNDSLGRPGYYWLAYAWTNLFLSCQLCNQRHKKNLFPLKDPSRRAISHNDVVAEEEPLFVDPAGVDPADYIDFREEYAYAIDGNPIGKTTIDALQLNRADLVEVRRDRLGKLRALKGVRDALAGADPGPDLSAQLAILDAALKQAIENSAEYVAMARAVLRS